MSATMEAAVNLVLRNIEVGPTTEEMRADPTPGEPARQTPRAGRMYRLRFSAERPGLSATFELDLGWTARSHDDECAVGDLEDVGRTLIREFATALGRST